MVNRFKKFIAEDVGKVVFLTLFYLVTQSLSGVPYLSLVFKPWVILFLVFLSATFIFNLKKEVVVFSIIFLVFLSLLSTLVGIADLSERIGDFMFGLLVLFFVMQIKDFLSEIKNRR